MLILHFLPSIPLVFYFLDTSRQNDITYIPLLDVFIELGMMSADALFHWFKLA